MEANKRQIQVKQREFQADRNVVQKAMEKVGLTVTFDGLELRTEGHEVAIERLLVRLKQLREDRRTPAEKLAEILDQRVITDNQIATVRAALQEIKKDIVFARDLPEIQQLAKSAASVDAEVRNADAAMAEIQAALNARRDDVSLADIIESKGRRIASDLFQEQFDGLTDEISKLMNEVIKIEEKLSALKDRKRRDKIVAFYARLMLSYLDRLDVSNYSVQGFTKLPARISETGSDLPRSILAYGLAILNTMNEFSTSFFGPIVIDSPNQQDQDAKNVGAMIDLIVKAVPDDAQVILGTVSLHDQTFEDADIIEFTDKLRVLRADEFESVQATLQPFVDLAADAN